MLPRNEYEILVSSANDTKNTNVKRLHSSSLQVFNKHLENIEKINRIDIEHLNSRLQFNLKRADTPHLIANGRCHVASSCPVTYKFYKKTAPDEIENYIQITSTVYDVHQHISCNNDKPPQVRGKDREELGKKILIAHGGSCYDARLTDLCQNGKCPNKIIKSLI